MAYAKVLWHPAQNRALTDEEAAYVDACAMRAMEGYISRGTNLTSADIADISYKTAFMMLDVRQDRYMKMVKYEVKEETRPG
jgi:hypothetical protein